jgi:hypothetical protein
MYTRIPKLTNGARDAILIRDGGLLCALYYDAVAHTTRYVTGLYALATVYLNV